MSGIRFGVLVLAGLSLQAAETAAVPSPNEALERYLGNSGQSAAWSPASIDIDASIPRLSKRGRLVAIRRLLPFGRPEYQVLESEGDRTVRTQVIARYLNGEEEAAAMPAASVAISPANYRFHYRGTGVDDGVTAYVFDIVPHKKRAGLIRGQIWIDPATGRVLRQVGRLVKSPSIFIRRINVTREIAVFQRTTHLEIDTRLVGRTELTITERPYAEVTEAQPPAGSK